MNPCLATVQQLREKYQACEGPPDQEEVLPKLAAALDKGLEREGKVGEMEYLDFHNYLLIN